MPQCRRLALALFLVFQGLYLLLASGQLRSLDEFGNHYIAESLWLDHTTAVPRMETARRFYGRIGRDGLEYTPWGPGQPLLGVPYYAVLGPALANRFPSWSAQLALEMATSLVSTTTGAACVAVFFLVAVRLGAARRTSALAAVILGTSTLVATYSTQAFSEPLVALLAVAGIGSLGVALETRSPRFFALASAAAGYAFWCRFVPGGLLLAALVIGYAVERRRAARWAEALGLVLPCLLAVAAHLALNFSRFGDPLQFGHPDPSGADRNLTSFETPLATGLFGMLLSPGKSIFIFAPALALALFGLPERLRARPGPTAAALAFGVGALATYATYSQWEGGYCFGPRYLVPALPGLFLALPGVLDRGRALWASVWVASGVGAVVQFFGIATSFVEAQQHRGYYDGSWAYRLAYSPLEHVTLAAHYLRTLGTERALVEPTGAGLNSWLVVMIKAGASPWAAIGWAGTALSLVVLGSYLWLRAHRLSAGSGDANQLAE